MLLLLPIMDQKICLNLVKKINCVSFEGFAQNGCYRNQPQPFEVVFYSINTNTPRSFIKQDLIIKQAYCGSFCLILCNKPKF